MTRFISPREDVKLLVVSVPEEAHSFELYDNNVVGGKCIMYLRGEPDYACEYTPNLPPGEYIPLGIATELPEEVMVEILEQIGDLEVRDDIRIWFDYEHDELNEDMSAESSWHSLLRRERITERVYVLRLK